MSHYVTNEHLIFFNIAASMGSIRFMNVLEDRHIDVHPKFAEANTLTYGTRVDFDNARVDLSLNVRRVFSQHLIVANSTKVMRKYHKFMIILLKKKVY